MRLFLESSSIFAERSGIGHYAKRLIEAYHSQYPEQQIRLFGFKFMTRPFHPPIPNDKTLGYRLIRWLPGRIYTGLFKYGASIPIDILIGASKKDVILFPNFVRWPLMRNKRSLAIIHDLSFELFGQFSSGPNREYMLKHVPKTVKQVDRIITISESSKRDIISHYKIPDDKISIVTPFTDSTLFRPRSSQEIDEAKKKFSISGDYILFVSSIEPRKNVSGLLDAYSALSGQIQKKYALVLAGGKGWLNEDIHDKILKLRDRGLNITVTGYVADEDLPALYSGATLFTFTSFYEGFGIPPLEAMACGVPVIASNNSSIPEVVGDAAVLVDANRSTETTKAIERLLKDPAKRKSMVQKGYKQAGKFNPQNSAKQLHEAIQMVL